MYIYVYLLDNSNLFDKLNRVNDAIQFDDNVAIARRASGAIAADPSIHGCGAERGAACNTSVLSDRHEIVELNWIGLN